MGCDVCDQKASASPPFSPAAVHTCSARNGAKRQVHTRPAKLDFSKLLPPSSPVPIIQGGPGSPGPLCNLERAPLPGQPVQISAQPGHGAFFPSVPQAGSDDGH